MMESSPQSGLLFAYAALFFCIAVGFLVVRRPRRGPAGPGYWALAYLVIGCGLVLWAHGAALRHATLRVVVATTELAGPFLIGWGASRYAGLGYRRWHLITLTTLALAWAAIALLILLGNPEWKIGYTVLRALLVMASGVVFLLSPGTSRSQGSRIAGWGLILSALLLGASAAGPRGTLGSSLSGWIVGLSAVSAFGMALVSGARRQGARTTTDSNHRFTTIVPVCSYCKRIRNTRGQWLQMEEYLQRETGIDFSHGICPDCAETHYPQFGLYRKNE